MAWVIMKGGFMAYAAFLANKIVPRALPISCSQPIKRGEARLCLKRAPTILHRVGDPPSSFVSSTLFFFNEQTWMKSFERSGGERAAPRQPRRGAGSQLLAQAAIHRILEPTNFFLQGVQRLLIQLWSGIFSVNVDGIKYPLNHLIYTWGDFVWHMKHHGTFNGSQDKDGNSFW